MSEHPEPRPRDDTDVLKDIARELADIAHQIATFNGEANAYTVVLHLAAGLLLALAFAAAGWN